MAQPVGPLFGTRWPNRAPGSVPARTFPAPLQGGEKKVGPMMQVSSQDENSTGGGAGSAPPSGRKKSKATVLGAEI